MPTPRITAAISAAPTQSTRTVYAHAWSQWGRWCKARGIPALPGDPLALCAYLTERAESGRAMGALDLSCTAIRHVHHMCGVEDPVAAESVRQVRRGLRRTYGAAPRRLARPLTIDEIRQIVAAIDRTTPIGIRDAAMILLGYSSALRRAELVALTLADIEHKPAGLLLNVRRSKMDQEGHGELVAVAHGSHAITDPVAALAAWRCLRGDDPGALFTRIWASRVSLESVSGHVVARLLRARAEAAGLDGTRITAHSLRAGHATTAAQESRSTALPPRPGTRTSPSSSTATSAHSRHLPRPPATTWDCDRSRLHGDYWALRSCVPHSVTHSSRLDPRVIKPVWKHATRRRSGRHGTRSARDPRGGDLPDLIRSILRSERGRVEDEIGARHQPGTGSCVVRQVVEAPLLGVGLVLVGGDSLPHHDTIGLDHDVHHLVPERRKARLQLMPVVLVQDGLGSHKVLARDSHQLVDDQWRELPPRLQLLEVGEVLVGKVVHQHEADPFRVEQS